MARAHNRQPMVNRMARIEGHVRAVRAMLVSDRDCPEVLIQLRVFHNWTNHGCG
ncbi:metal-sensing transcriptional repressor [Sulfobacillus harzensis]|uniref:Metal-sensing transcriptional repressor n=1 Tax=Sulfobacillus harzensis TaxID=2729629 RepID=A0A7Y0Q3Y7_9FIRM|nr:metal-sensing transcriptional repressor [Sulfobacillus harzensis]NMP24768.1 metal-sensing transcriptional repressor [Sulfobacillus harzensis]